MRALVSPALISENRPTVRMRVDRKGSQNAEAFVDESKTVCLDQRV